mgnify:CR=1 FL=1
MKIGIDARLWNETGIGRYIRALVSELFTLDQKNEYTLFLQSADMEKVSIPKNRWNKIAANIHWHTVSEQLQMPKIIDDQNLDLVHIPYFSVPVFLRTPFVVTVHDLTISRFPTGKATTLPLSAYYFKRLGYSFVLQQAIRKSKSIITVSETVKKQILAQYDISPSKITVTYESGELKTSQVHRLVASPKHYILYVGNAHPHKNLTRLLESFQSVMDSHRELQLVLVGKRDYFYDRLEKEVARKSLTNRVHFAGEVNDSQLNQYYQQADFFVFPSLSEGFGIPGLEAMWNRCPAAVSDISIFHEIYGDAALYFDEKNPADMAAVFSKMLMDKNLTGNLIKNGLEKAHEYSWKKMAQETLAVYENCISL